MSHKLWYRSTPGAMVLLLLAGLMALTALATAPAASASTLGSPQASQATAGRVGTKDLETFTDELIGRQLADYHIAGAIVSIVQDGKIELARGYGYADVEEQVPVTPDETIFRIGSTSKLFTWTAVMQLAEQGKIDLHADINIYLRDFKIPATFPEPITMLHLLSHTAGFEERATGTEASSPAEMDSLHDYLKGYMPDRIRPPGELSTYSNYGTSLAGYIVEVTSGMPFEQYMETYIFEPLSMSHSTFRQPLPADFKSHLAVSYSYNGSFVPRKYTYPNLLPAATMCSTAHDMANFILAHLQNGQFEGKQILRPETAQEMHSHLFSVDERLDGFAYGFMEWNFNGQRVLYHNGDIGNWHSALAILPEANVGFFVSYNSNESLAAVNEFYLAFMNTFFPVPKSAYLVPVKSYPQDTVGLAGEYRNTRSFYNHVERIIQFPGKGNIRVAVNPDGTLSIAGQIYYKRDFLVYASPDGLETVIFHQDENGKTTHLQFNGLPMFAFERLSWYETTAFILGVSSACALLLLSGIVAALIRIIRRRNEAKGGSRLSQLAWIWALSLSVVFLLLPMITYVYMTIDIKAPFPFYMVIVQALMLVASILVIGPVLFTILAWMRRDGELLARIDYSLITLALMVMVWMLYYWRLLGFRS